MRRFPRFLLERFLSWPSSSVQSSRTYDILHTHVDGSACSSEPGSYKGNARENRLPEQVPTCRQLMKGERQKRKGATSSATEAKNRAHNCHYSDHSHNALLVAEFHHVATEWFWLGSNVCFGPSNVCFGPRSRLSVEGESTSGSCNTSRKNYIGSSVVQVRMASPGCLTDGCPNVHTTNLDC